ncbi:hypothetical protein ACFU5O_24690 [Streptomyces sp. NPDC057445]|uniref:hypothetical protein n=1 Tax=Streptomyces sp. NPDC057445 TaxID=3346136 RepID=UPI0036821B52
MKLGRLTVISVMAPAMVLSLSAAVPALAEAPSAHVVAGGPIKPGDSGWGGGVIISRVQPPAAES